MAPLALVVEGDTLGQRHRHYNKIVKESIEKNVPLSDLRDQEASTDLDAIFKIDLASHYRDVPCIFAAFKSEDMLQVSRAINQSVWLITDNQYKHFINIKYLKDQLFPQMTSKAICKLLLTIRINLKDEERVDEFYRHYENDDVNVALRWLPYCSVKVMEEAVAKYHNKISVQLFKRLCEKSITVLEVLLNTPMYCRTQREYAQAAMFLMNTDSEKFVDLTSKLTQYAAPTFNAKHTELLMEHCKERVLDKFDYYSKLIHLPTFGKCLGKDQIRPFLLRQTNDEVPAWFNYKYLKPLIDIMPTDGKFDFIKSVFIDKDQCVRKVISPPRSVPVAMMSRCAMPANSQILRKKKSYIQPSTSHKSVYELYRHAPFHVAFPELKNLIRSEASSEERGAMLGVLAGCARSAPHVLALLTHYRDHHLNEPFSNKLHFVHTIISKTRVHQYDEHQWNLLQVLFNSMDVYVESEANVQRCIEADIIYRTVRGEPIPEIVIKKFNWNTMNTFYKQLNETEREKVFKFLYDIKEKKMSSQQTLNDKTIGLLDDLLQLLVDWNKNIEDYLLVIEKLKAILQSKKFIPSFGPIAYEIFNNKKKSWLKYLFEESLIVNSSESAVINALKHDPTLLKRYKYQVDIMRSNDQILPKILLQKLRTYFPELASEWAAAYREQLGRPQGRRAAARALCMLLPPSQFIPFVKTYVPDDYKIDWQTSDAGLINTQKIIAQNMHLARPQPSPDVVLLFLKGDYVQFALPSLSAIYYNMNSIKARESVGKLLDAPVSIQKHGIRYAVVRMNLQELEETLDKIWQNTKNSSIRAVIFQITFDQLCRQKNPDTTLQYWELLAKFITSLSMNENKIIYSLLTKVEKVPDKIKGKFCETSYKFLKRLPVKSGFAESVNMLAGHMASIMERVDPQFVRQVLLEHVDTCFRRDMQRLTEDHHMRDVIAAYLLCVDTETEQMERYNEILVPIMEFVFANWDVELKDAFIYREYFEHLFTRLLHSLRKNIAKPRTVVPTKMFSAICITLQTQTDNVQYVTQKSWALTVKFLELADKFKQTLDIKETGDEKLLEKSENKEWDLLCIRLIPEFSLACINSLNAEVSSKFPSMTIIFSKALERMLSQVIGNRELSDFKNIFYKSVLEKSEDVSVYVSVLSLLPDCCYDEQEIKKLEELKMIVYNHPSEEVKMHYFCKYENKPKVITYKID